MPTWISIANGMGAVDVSGGLEGQFFLNKGSTSDAGPPPDQWTPVNLTAFGVPADAKCIDIHGILVITMGNTPGFTNLCVAFRRPGDEAVTIRGHYIFQCVGNTGDGERSGASAVLTPVNGVIEWAWFTTGVQLGWPQFSSVAVNLTVARWFK
jgi:hypothetical protein